MRHAKPTMQISEMQMAIMLASAFTALGLYVFPRDLVSAAGNQVFAPLLVAALVSVVPLLLWMQLALYFPGLTPYQYARQIFGPVVGQLVGIWLAFFYTVLAASTLRQFGDLSNTLFLPETPSEVVMLLMLTAVIYTTWHGLEGTARFISFTYPLLYATLILIFAYGLVFATELEALRAGFVLDPVVAVRGARAIMYEFAGIEAVALLLPFVRQPRHPYRYALGALGINTLLLLLILIVTIGIFGFEALVELQYPGASALRVIRLPGLLIERLGSFLAITWTMLGLLFLCIRFFTVPIGLAHIFRLPSDRARWFLLPMGICAIGLARIPGSPAELEFITHQILVPVGWVTGTLLPALMLVVAKVRRLEVGA